MSRDETPTVNSVGQTTDSIVFELDRETARRLADDWQMFDDEVDAVREVVRRGVEDLDSMRDMLDDVEHRDVEASDLPWRSSA
jgi:putative heme degradation protein